MEVLQNSQLKTIGFFLEPEPNPYDYEPNQFVYEDIQDGFSDVSPTAGEVPRSFPGFDLIDIDREAILGPCRLPAELQMLVMELADWIQHPVMSQVCRFWRHFIKTSPVVLMNRYRPVYFVTDGFDRSPAEQNNPRPRPWVHMGLMYLRQFVPTETSEGWAYIPRKLEVSSYATKRKRGKVSKPSCRSWPDMAWGLFKDDLVTIFPGTDPSTLHMAKREIVTEFLWRPGDEGSDRRVFPLGPVATIASYLAFTRKLIAMETIYLENPTEDDYFAERKVVELYMHREPVQFFSPIGYDTDNLRLWFQAKVHTCIVMDDTNLS